MIDELDIPVSYAISPPNEQSRASDVYGFPYFQTVTAVPTLAPTDFRNQIVILNSPPGTYQLYIYETVSAAWKAVVIT